MSQEEIVGRMLEVLVDDILPMTLASVEKGNKVFGAAILRKANLELVIAGVNEETENPLLHGEISCLNRYWGMQSEKRPAPSDCLFLSTHEPCSMCLSAITWSGFDNFYYLFSYEDSRDSFNIPHDLRIMEEVFSCKDGQYERNNHFWSSHDLLALVDGSDGEHAGKWQERVTRLREAYARLSNLYQDGKESRGIPLD